MALPLLSHQVAYAEQASAIHNTQALILSLRTVWECVSKLTLDVVDAIASYASYGSLPPALAMSLNYGWLLVYKWLKKHPNRLV